MPPSAEHRDSGPTATSILLGYLMDEVAAGYPIEQALPNGVVHVEAIPVAETGLPSRPLHPSLQNPPVMEDSLSLETLGQSSKSGIAWSSGSTRRSPRSNLPVAAAPLTRQDTILAAGSSPQRTTKELKTLLGGSGAKVKTGAMLPTGADIRNPAADDSVLHLEGGNSKARVQLDLLLESDTCVQGGYLNGNISITVQKKTDQIVMVADGRMRLIGFECTMQEKTRSIFYEEVVALSSVSPSLDDLYLSGSDEEGFMLANEGRFSFPFSFKVSTTPTHGVPKGSFPSHSGVSLRYIVMVSIRIKDPISEKRSVAHFYRHIYVWPQLELVDALSPLPRPIQVTMSESGGNLKLTATLHRLQWVAGQTCFLRLCIANKTTKSIRSLTVELYRDTIVFRHPRDSANSGEENTGPMTTSKLLLVSVLPLGDRAEKGYAGAKGWWTGVLPGETMQFSHSFPIPVDALSVSKGKLLEISYRVKTTISSGNLLPTELSAEVPIRIINFMSLDPPPTYPSVVPTLTSVDTTTRNLGSQPYSSIIPGPMPSSTGAIPRSDTVEAQPEVAPAVEVPEMITSTSTPSHFADLYWNNLQDMLDDQEPQTPDQSMDSSLEYAVPQQMSSLPTKSSVYSQETLQTMGGPHAPPMSTSRSRAAPPAMRSNRSAKKSGQTLHFATQQTHEALRLEPSPQMRKLPSRKLPQPPGDHGGIQSQVGYGLTASVSQGSHLHHGKAKAAQPRPPGTPPRRTATMGSAGSFRIASPLSPGASSVKDKIKELENRVKAIESGAGSA